MAKKKECRPEYSEERERERDLRASPRGTKGSTLPGGASSQLPYFAGAEKQQPARGRQVPQRYGVRICFYRGGGGGRIGVDHSERSVGEYLGLYEAVKSLNDRLRGSTLRGITGGRGTDSR